MATLPGRVSFSERTSLKSRSPTGAAGSQRMARLKAKNQGYEPTKEATFSEIGEITLIAGHSRLPPSPAAAVSGPSLRYIETSRPATVFHARRRAYSPCHAMRDHRWGQRCACDCGFGLTSRPLACSCTLPGAILEPFGEWAQIRALSTPTADDLCS